MISTKRREQGILLVILVTILSIVAMSYAVPYTKLYAETEVSPFPPAPHENVDYTMTMPTLNGRLTRDETTGKATLFAPNTTIDSGWYDANKIFPQDSQLCWAASDSNVIAWYLDYMKKIGLDTAGYDTELNSIFNNYRNNWAREGYDPLMGLSWYFTSNFPTGGYPSNLINKGSGGYLANVRGNTSDGWYNLYPANGKFTFGNYGEKFPFVQDMSGHYYENDPLYSHESFSKTIIEQLHYGAVVLSIAKESSSGASHAITLWGVDIDANGLITKLYVTDSDDSITQMVGVDVKKRAGNRGGVLIKMQPGLGIGDASPYTRVIASTVLYAPNVINAVEIKDPTKPECTHEYESKYDSTHHYEECKLCGDIKGKEEHIFGEWIVDTKPTHENVGGKHRACKCGYVEYATIDALVKPEEDKPNSNDDSIEKPEIEMPETNKPEVDKPNINEPDINKPNIDTNLAEEGMSLGVKLAIAIPSTIIPLIIVVVIIMIKKRKI